MLKRKKKMGKEEIKNEVQIVVFFYHFNKSLCGKHKFLFFLTFFLLKRKEKRKKIKEFLFWSQKRFRLIFLLLLYSFFFSDFFFFIFLTAHKICFWFKLDFSLDVHSLMKILQLKLEGDCERVYMLLFHETRLKVKFFFFIYAGRITMKSEYHCFRVDVACWMFYGWVAKMMS